MNSPKKPLIGVLALMLPDYEPLFPGITDRQTRYVESLLSPLKEELDFHFPRPALGREATESLVREMNQAGCDGIMVLPLSYSQGQYLVRAMQDNRLPVALCLVQPDETVGNQFIELDLTVNQGIHGIQDNANALRRAGLPYQVYAGEKGEGFQSFLRDFAAAAGTRTALKRMRIGVIGKLPGMGDVSVDDMAFYRQIGPELVYDSIGTVQRHTAAVTESEIDSLLRRDRALFELAPDVTEALHRDALRMYLGIKGYLKEAGHSGYTVQFSEFAEDGRFPSIPMLAASHLMADGYGYAAEGDAPCAALLAAMQRLCGPSNFSEMYMMDLPRQAILFCHAGEGNWKISRRDKKPRLIHRHLDEGGMPHPASLVFTPAPGPAAVLSIQQLDGRFRLGMAEGEVLDKDDLENCEMPYMFFRPRSGVEACVSRWLQEGFTHHEVVVFGDHRRRIELLCRMLGVELISL